MLFSDLISDLAGKWREEAAIIRRRGAVALADAAEGYASDLEAALREWQLAILTLEEAADESGYSYSALQKRVAAGELPNAGKKGSPRIRRADLYQRAKGQPTLAESILAGRLGSH